VSGCCYAPVKRGSRTSNKEEDQINMTTCNVS
jgi:hypothetical protein